MRKLALFFAFLLFFNGGSPFALAKQTDDIRLVFGGDVTLASWYGTLAGSSDPAWPFQKLRPYFKTADLVMVNCETSITDRGTLQTKEFNFRMNPELVSAFSENGITIVSIANNHVCDYGEEGLRDTVMYLDRAGVAHVGAGMNLSEARKPVWRVIKGKRFAFLAYGNYSPATAEHYGVAYRSPVFVVSDIRSAKEKGADLVVVNFHWGTERAAYPTESDRRIAHAAVDAGADIVVGHHPHVLQPVEIYHGKVIAYSLGNFVFGGNRNPGRNSALLEVSVSDPTIDYRLVPIRISAAETKYQPYIIAEGLSGLATR